MDKMHPNLVGKLNEMRARAAERDNHQRMVAQARRGEIHAVMPGVFPRNWPKPMIANVLDTTARELSENLARLPQIECVTANTTSDTAKKHAAKKTKVALYYVDHSRLRVQLYSGADWFFSYGAMPIVVEPDFQQACPVLRVDSPVGAYWELDLHGRTKIYAKVWPETVGSLRAKFPELYGDINPGTGPFGEDRMPDDAMLEVVRMYTDDRIFTFLPERHGLILRTAPNPLGRVPVVIAERPKWDESNRGQFDDVMWVWLARARMAAYGLEAADKAVRAPLAVPQDVQTISFGPDAIVRSNEPDKIRRVALDLPSSAIIESQLLDQEISAGTRMPKAVTGQVDASIITGQGVEALANTFSTQIATAQDIIGDCLRRALRMAFEYDEKVWPNLKKTVDGTANGAPFTESYTPSKDINGDYNVSVTYGFTAGMDPNRALVFLLQMRGDQAIDRDTLQRQLPFDIDVEQLQRRIDTEQIEDALKQGVFQDLAMAPAMAQQMQDPQFAYKAFQRAAALVKLRNKGKTITDAVLEAYEPEPEPEPTQQEQLAQAFGVPPEATGAAASPEAHAQLGQGGSPDLQMMLAGLTQGGEPNLSAAVSRRMPA